MQIRTFFPVLILSTAFLSVGRAQTPVSNSPEAIPSAPDPASQQIPALPPYNPDPQKQPAQQGAPAAPTSIPSAPIPQPAPAPQPPPDAPERAYPSYNATGALSKPKTDALGSAYVSMDSWVYPAVLRLYSMGFLDAPFLSVRPWTRRSVLHMIQKAEPDIMASNNDEAEEILAKLLREFEDEVPSGNVNRGVVYGLHSTYTRFMGIGGPVLRDSYHLGQTFYNDYGRPYGTGFNNITGFSTLNEAGRFSLYVRGEYQHSPSGGGYSYDLASQLAKIDRTIPYAPPLRPQDTIPEGPLKAQNQFRLVEAYASFHLLGHEISGGKSDAWLGPGMGGALAWTNNAENIYSFRINRVEPMYIPGVSKVLGPVRYDFFYGSLKGHTSPNNPYAHSEIFAFQPTKNFEFSFQRTIIFGGKGHAPVTLHTFLKGFFDLNDTTYEEKFSRNDPGARYSSFSFAYRLPFVRKYATFYTDAISHDDVTPISAPRRASYRTGLYISQFPGRLKKMDFRVEAANTDPDVGPSHGGEFNYWEVIQLQGYTNKGYIMGDWMGREAKGGQAWLTYHLSGDEWIQMAYMRKKIPGDFIPLGTTQNQFKVSFVKRFGPDVELNSWVQYEGWKAPIYKIGYQQNTTAAFQLTWYPKLQRLPR
ncbi:capsule assembly Wzi family protein [Edaphobacter albus]|uniref:capsule assembly Wzi family protein n=1 Tax=Edaphobacter sp. 4G125 TaxID=2763071 RepID=UPI0016488BB3|nr:capsule assembly Wzi family protein [Edaphobacter sp. 4G125]QNI35522.1 capsule assembly Wzi family protein [Edaphobacter sp. 4G125]